MTLLLVGAGGHAKAIVEALSADKRWIDAFVDPRDNTWLPCQQISTDEEAWSLEPGEFVLGVGGDSLDDLARRFDLFQAYQDRDWEAPAVVHSTAHVNKFSILGEGTIVLTAAVVQPGALIGDAVIINTGAIVEHDCVVGSGSHLAPHATLLGNCRVGSGCMIGAGAVVLPGAVVPNETLVPALTRYPATQ